MNRYVASVDAGTGGERCVIFDLNGRAMGQAFREIPTIYPKPGWAEQDPNLLIENAFDAVRGAIENGGIDASEICAVSFTAQQTSFAPIDRDGRFLYNLIVWQDTRGAEEFGWMRERLAEFGMTEADLFNRCGHPLDTMQSGGKTVWLRRHMPDIYEKTWQFVTPQAMLTHAFGGGDWIDDSGADGWWLISDIEKRAHDPILLRAFEMDPAKYPRMEPSDKRIGEVCAHAAERSGLKAGTPIFTGAGDQSCAALGAGNYGTKEIGSVCLGTAGVALAYSPTPTRPPERTFNVLGYPSGGYALEGGTAVSAASLRWLRDILYPASDYPQENLYSRMIADAMRAPVGAGGVTFLPYLAGSVCPRYDVQARGAFVGMTLASGRPELTRAVLEGVCYEMRDILEAYRRVGAGDFKKLRAIGGACHSDFWCQMQADIYNCPVETVDAVEATSLGAAMIAAAGAGLFGSLREACEQMVHLRRRYEPDAEAARRYEECYREAYQCCCRDLSNETFASMAALNARG